MASTCHGLFLFASLLIMGSQIAAFPTPADSADDKSVYNRQLTEEKPLQEQIAEADSVKESVQSADTNPATSAKDLEQDGDDFAMLKSLADGQKSTNELKAAQTSQEKEQYAPDDADSTKSRHDPETFRQVDGTPLTAEDIVQKIANKIYEEHDRGVFDRIVAKLLKLGLITDSQAETLEYQVAEALQDLITRNAKNNEIEDLEGDYTAVTRGEQKAQPSRATDAQERETLITIMKTLIDFVKMMVKYGTITPEEGVSYLENLDAMIAMQTKNKLGKALGTPDFSTLTAGKLSEDDDNTKLEAAKMQKEYENLKDSTKGEQPPTEINYDLSKLKDFMDQQVESYIEKGIIAKDEGETIKRIYSSL
ncbi:hypothetical protein CRUP_008013 [Coryphaenoides rupestris]|nr:hypothetical protein CRUP_008013 [Coryphaenoides rupestris]